MVKPSTYRTFNGKRYVLMTRIARKRDATKRVLKLRRAGYSVRLIKHQDAYTLYTRA